MEGLDPMRPNFAGLLRPPALLTSQEDCRKSGSSDGRCLVGHRPHACKGSPLKPQSNDVQAMGGRKPENRHAKRGRFVENPSGH